MNQELQRIYDSTPEDESRSKLEPYRELILRWRRQGRSYRKIQQMLRDECHTPVATMTLHEFVKLRSRPRKPQPDLDIEEPVERSSAVVSAAERKPRMTAEERAALRASYDQPLFPSEEQKPLFVRRPGPIRNLNNETQGEK